MSVKKVRSFFEENGIKNKIMEFAVSSATVALAAEAIGCEEARIAKSLSFKVGSKPILVVAAGDARIDNQKFKQTFEARAKMLSSEEVLESIGYPVGGVCPFGVNAGVDVYLDFSLKRFETVFPACGSSNSAVELTLAELENASGCKAWVDVCKLT